MSELERKHIMNKETLDCTVENQVDMYKEFYDLFLKKLKASKNWRR